MSRYFQFLSNIVGRRNYNLLLQQLDRIEFYSFVPNDDNREEDGKRLREIYLDELNTHHSLCRIADERDARQGSSSLQILPSGPCSMLEMLIGISYRMENELEGSRFEKKVDDCFWELIENLDLDQYDNQTWAEMGSDDAIDYKIGIFLDRKYDRKGNGGLFPLVRTRNDQRKVEIWYQMCEYLMENYPI